MRTTIDRSGRLVVPKELRTRLGLSGQAEVDIEEVDGVLEVRPVGPKVWLEESDGKPVLAVSDEVPPLTVAEVRRLLEEGRR